MATIDSNTEGAPPAETAVMPSTELVPDPTDTPTQPSPTRGRKRRRHSAISASPERSPSPSRGHSRRSASRHREKRRWRQQRTRSQESDNSSTSPSRKPPSAGRRSSDAAGDHTFRGRARLRSRSRTEEAIAESSSEGLEHNPSGKLARLVGEGTHRKRSLPPSRDSVPANATGDESSQQRRQRSLPNQYREIKAGGEGT
jgi:hypothetical protein